MVLPEIPTEISSRVKGLFRSDSRKKIAMELLFFDHWPTSQEKEELASRYSIDVANVGKTMYVLRDKGFMTKDQGSIPLYRIRLKNELAIPDGPDGTPNFLEDTIPYSGNEDDIMEGLVESLPERTDIPPTMETGDKINVLDTKIHSLNGKLDNFMAEIRTTINALSTSSPKNNPNDQPENEEPESIEDRIAQLEKQQYDDETKNPFDGLSRDQIIELIQSQPQEVITMANPRTEGGRVQGQKVTLRPMILMLTTYSQMLYEKAVYDGYFTGTLSDFANFTMEQYFTDRGWGLDWNRREPANNMRRMS